MKIIFCALVIIALTTSYFAALKVWQEQLPQVGGHPEFAGYTEHKAGGKWHPLEIIREF